MNNNIFIFICLACAILFTCCGGHIGYGVFLWEYGQSSYKTGEKIKILSKSAIRKTYIISKKNGKGKIEIPAWRVAFFKKSHSAESFAQKYAMRVNIYAYSQKKGLPIRDISNQSGEITYKLRLNQVVKVLEKEEKKSKAGVFENYWYRILTEEGYSGYCFGKFLKIFETEDDPFKKAKVFQSRDTQLDKILTNIWRPEYFADMINARRYSLRKFKNNIGFFPSPEENQFKLTTNTRSYVFNYTDIKKIGSGIYIFKGTDLRIEIFPWDKLSVTYPQDGKMINNTFILIKRDIDGIIMAEFERREAFYTPFVMAVLKSSAYGTIRFEEDSPRFQWEGFEKLKPHIIPNGCTSHGKVEFLYYPIKSLQKDYNGVITFTFSGMKRKNDINFLYCLEKEGVRFVFVSKGEIRDLVVKRAGVPSLVLFFRFE